MKAEEFLGLGGVEGGVGGARIAVVIFEEAGLQLRIKLRPAGGKELADLIAGEAFGAGDVKEAGLVADGKLPDGLRGGDDGDGTAKFVGEQGQGAALLAGAAHFLVEAAVTGGRYAGVKRGADDDGAGMGEDNLLGGGL